MNLYRKERKMGEPSDLRMCVNCLYSFQLGSGQLVCRRFPPAFQYVMPVGGPQISVPGKNNHGNMMSFFGFPLVQPDYWCGEHRFAKVEVGVDESPDTPGS